MWSNLRPSATDDETVVGGFCTNALFRITSDEVVTQHPIVTAEVQNQKMVLAVDKGLFLLEDESVVKCNSFLNFGNNIEAMTVTSSGTLVLCALADGNIHIVHINGTPIFNLTIHESDINRNGRTFVGFSQIKDDFFLMCTSGKLYRLFNLNEQFLSESVINRKCENGNESSVINDSILTNAAIECVLNPTKSYKNNICSFCVLPDDINENQFLSVFAGNGSVNFVNKFGDSWRTLVPKELGNIKGMYNLENFTLCLTESGDLVELWPQTMLIRASVAFDYLVDDLVVIANDEDTIELILLTKSNEIGNRCMKIVEYPSLRCSYEVSVHGHMWLIRQSKSSVNMYYLHGLLDDESGDVIQEIEMKIVSETQPDQRFKKLIQRGRLEEAESFAIQYNLSLQPIYEAKVRRLWIEIKTASRNNSPQLQPKFEEMLSLARLITSSEFLLNLKVIDIAERNTMRRFLLFLLEHIQLEVDAPEISQINEQLLRLKTVEINDPFECNWKWQQFVLEPNLISVVIQMFKTDVSMACLIWKHHASSILPFKDTRSVENILKAIPSATLPFDVILWLRHFVPVISQIHPNTMTTVANWCIDKTRTLQYSPHWPQIGLEFITNIFNIFNENSYIFSDTQRLHEVNITKMQAIINVLQDLSVLKKSYNLTFTMDDYIKDNIEDTAFRILQRVNLNYLKNMTRDFLYPIFIEKGLSPVNAIIRYITFLVKNRKSISAWQERAVAAVDLLHNEEDRLLATLNILKSAPVPWSPVLNPLLKYRVSTHPLSAAISTEYERQTIKILKIKYGWPADSATLLMPLACRIVKLNLPEMIDDIEIVVRTDQSLGASINFYCAYEISRRGHLEQAIAFIHSLGTAQVRECCHKIVNIVSELLDSKLESATTQSNLMELLAEVSDKLDAKDRRLYDEVVRLQNLRQQFDLDVTLVDLRKACNCEFLLQEGIKYLYDNVKDCQSNIVQKAWNDIEQLAKALQLDQLKCVVYMLRHFRNLNFSCIIGKVVVCLCVVNASNYVYYVDLAVLLLVQQMEAVITGDKDDELPMSYPLAFHLLESALAFCKIGQDDQDVRELINWIRIGNNAYCLNEIDSFLNDQTDLSSKILEELLNQMSGNVTQNKTLRRESMSIFDQVADTQEQVMPHSHAQPVIRCLSYALNVFLSLEQDVQAFSTMRKYVEISTDLYEDAKNEFTSSLEHLIKAKQYSVACMLMQNVMKIQQQVKCVIIPKAFAHVVHKKILRHALTQKEPNYFDIQAVLLSDSKPEDCLTYLANELNGSMRVHYLTLLEMYNSSMGKSSQVIEARHSRKKYFYFTELCKTDPSLKFRTDFDFNSPKQLFKDLQVKIIDVSLLERMSAEFSWKYDHVLMTQIVTILSSQKLDFDVKTDLFGKEDIVIKTNIDELKALCMTYVEDLSSTDQLACELIILMDTINSYFYELFICVIDLLVELNRLPREMELWRSVLLFLKHKMTTKRRNRIGQNETDAWLKTQEEVGVMPAIAAYRFPFRSIVLDPLKNILDEEVNVQNCKLWFPLIRLHAAIMHDDSVEKEDYFCMTAVKNSISEYKSDTGIWNLQPINNAFLQAILRLVNHMVDLSKKIFVLYFVANHAPEGADQVEAAYECYKFAKQHAAKLSQIKRAQEITDKIMRKYPIYRTQHLLQLYGLSEGHLLRLVESPRDLIEALYSHACILKPQKTDINKAAKEIAELHQLNFTQIQVELLEKWLSSTVDVNGGSLDETFYEDVNMSLNVEDDTNSDECIARTHYILRSWDVNKSIEFLILHIFPSDGAINTAKQLQAFECFMKLNDVSKGSYQNIVNQDEYVVLKCVHYLKQLGYKFTIAKFREYDKLTILKKVWASHSNVPKALEVIMYICTGYDIHIPKIWNSVLTQMVALDMIKQLAILVEVLSTKSSLLQVDGLAMAWEYVILFPFKSANKTRSFDQETILSKGLFLLQSCPLSSKLNLLKLAQTCVWLGRVHMAAICIPFAAENQKTEIMALVVKHKGESLRKDIFELEELGIYPMVTKAVITALEL